MNFSDEILDLKYQLDDVFGTESDDMVDEYDELGTEATVKGTTKRVVAFVKAICRKIIDLITRWVKNRQINKLVAFLKNKIAKFEKEDQAKAWAKLKKNVNGDSVWKHFVGMINVCNAADQLVRLNAINRQIKSIPIDKFGKSLKDIKTTVKGNKATLKFENIGSGDWPDLFPLINKVVTTSETTPEEITKAQCDTIGKCLKSLMACLSNFTLKTMHFYDRVEDQWLKTPNQKNVIKALQNTQVIVRDIIDVVNNAFTGVKTDNYDEKDEDDDDDTPTVANTPIITTNSVDMSNDLMDMYILNEDIDQLIKDMDVATESEDSDFDLDFEW